MEILYAFIPELAAHLSTMEDKESHQARQLAQVLEFLEDWFSSTKEELVPLLDSSEITYDLLWALFKPNEPIFTNDIDSEQPRCHIFDFGESQDRKGQKYFEIVCRSLLYDGK